MPRKPAQPPELLKEIRENYDWSLEYWTPVHKEGNEDVKFVAGDPWDPRDIQARENSEQKRPHLVFDEGSQYINQFIGQSMQQQRAVKVEPAPVDAASIPVDQKTAEIMQARIQHIDYTSRGPTHTIKGLRDCAIRGYGWISIRKKYSNDTSREQEPCYNPVLNPDSRLMDPDAKEVDGSDMEFCFVRDVVKKTYVKKKWKWAKDLGRESQKTITLTEYWKVEKKVIDQTLWLEDSNNSNGIEIKKSALPQGSKVGEDEVTMGQEPNTFVSRILDSRDIEERKITKYICQIVDKDSSANASPDTSAAATVEILEVEEWDGKWIPEVPVLGPVEHINDGGTVKVIYLSMLRRARQPMQLLNLTRTNEAEMVGMTPKTRFLGYEGQFEGHEEEFANIGSNPLAYLQVRPVIDPMAPTQVLPLPTVVRWEPPIQALELLAQSCMNAIRSAIGQLASPELDKGKSGVAIQKIQTEGASATYHITEAYVRSLEQVGRVHGDLIEKTHDTKRQVPVRYPDGKQKIVTLNAAYDEDGQRRHYPITPGGFNYTITTGPSFQSQFEQASDFVDKLVQSMPELLINGAGQTTFGDLFVKLKNLGPVGDQIVERFNKMLRPGLEDEQLDIPPQVQQELQKGQQVINALTQKVNELQGIISTKALELSSKDAQNKRDNETKLAVAAINASVKENIAQLEAVMDQLALKLNQQFDSMMAQMPKPDSGAPSSTASPSPNAVIAPPSGPQGAPAPTHAFDPESQQLQPVGAGQ